MIESGEDFNVPPTLIIVGKFAEAIPLGRFGFWRLICAGTTVIAAAVTSRIDKARLPTHIELGGAQYGLTKDSVILLEQIRTIDKRRLKERIGALPDATMSKVDTALLISLGFSEAEGVLH